MWKPLRGFHISTALLRRGLSQSTTRFFTPYFGRSVVLTKGPTIWYTIDGGGAMNSSGGSYSLSGSIGQPDAGTLNGGSYQLAGGFWGGASINYAMYLPLVLKSF